jgi:hypothetical protein
MELEARLGILYPSKTIWSTAFSFSRQNDNIRCGIGLPKPISRMVLRGCGTDTKGSEYALATSTRQANPNFNPVMERHDRGASVQSAQNPTLMAELQCFSAQAGG